MSELKYQWVDTKEFLDDCYDLDFDLCDLIKLMFTKGGNKMMNTVYLFECDGMGCHAAQDIGECPSPTTCRLTSDPKHAKNFIAFTSDHGKKLNVVEKKHTELRSDVEKETLDNIIEHLQLIRVDMEVNDAVYSGDDTDTESR